MVTLEVIACREALCLADDLFIHDMLAATDSKQVANATLKGSHGHYGQIITEIKAKGRGAQLHIPFQR